MLLVVASAASHHHHKPKPVPTTTTINTSSTTFTTSSTTAPVNGAACRIQGADPDPSCTPGAVNPAVTQANIGSTICVKGWTGTVRPPVSYTSVIKTNMMGTGTFTATYNGQTYSYRGYGVGGSQADAEEDHNLPLEAGGAPADPRNLWPEPGGTAHSPLSIEGVSANSLTKDGFENWSRAQICSGKITLSEGQSYFLGGKWFEAYLRLGKPANPYGSN